MEDSAITCDEMIYAEYTNFTQENITCKKQNFYILLAFLLITTALLIAVSIYFDMIKYQAKQKCHKLQIKRSFVLTIIYYIK